MYVPTYKPYVAYYIFIEHNNGGISRDLLQIDQRRRPEVGLNYRNTGKVRKPCEDKTGAYLSNERPT